MKSISDKRYRPIFPSGDVTYQSESTKERLEQYLKIINTALVDGCQLHESVTSPRDKELMKSLVSLANDEKCGLNAYYCDSPLEMMNKIKMMGENECLAHFVVNMGEGGTHYSAFEFLKKDEKLSIIGIEPSTTRSLGASLLAIRTSQAVKSVLPDASFIFIETDLQRSNGGCGIFSLFLVKKMFKERTAMLELHEKNISGAFESYNGVINQNISDTLIPPSFMKHAQSPKRLNYYLDKNPLATKLVINNKGETLKERQNRLIVTIENKGKQITYSNSIEVKRKIEIEKLLSKYIARDTPDLPSGSPDNQIKTAKS
ncbi:YopJ family acetyltransferase [Salmonella enterica]|uniref:YopJ family acetyltransferase n=1 Tax=Salmonella enterica TaxID=28901 RepID=UPI0009B0AB54|nr:YopJ family acetyltransferase [Salmonella enterica]EDI0785121.1 multidrug DMT transporter permease [Salmonella enterica subsp. enterica serovar Kasenyi]